MELIIFKRNFFTQYWSSHLITASPYRTRYLCKQIQKLRKNNFSHTTPTVHINHDLCIIHSLENQLQTNLSDSCVEINEFISFLKLTKWLPNTLKCTI